MQRSLNKKRLANAEKALIVLIFLSILICGLIRLYSFENNLGSLLTGTDDWNLYAKFGLDIKYNGLLIPIEKDIYQGPGGFLYNYFLAFCFLIFGDNIIPVYLIQDLFLGASILLIYLTFKNKMRPLTNFAFLICMFVFALLDVFKYYSFQLLSENLGLFILSLCAYCFSKGIENNKFSFQISAAFLFGLSIATRPNLFPIGIFLIILLVFYSFKLKKNMLKILAYSSLIVFGMCLLAIRNYIISGQIVFLPQSGISDSLHHITDHSAAYFVKKLLFCFGYLPALETNYHVRFHWILMWLGYFTYIIMRLRSPLKITLQEIVMDLFIVLYYTLSIIFVQVDSYGFRALLPVTFIVLGFSFMGFEQIITLKKIKTDLPFLHPKEK